MVPKMNDIEAIAVISLAAYIAFRMVHVITYLINPSMSIPAGIMAALLVLQPATMSIPRIIR